MLSRVDCRWVWQNVGDYSIVKAFACYRMWNSGIVSEQDLAVYMGQSHQLKTRERYSRESVGKQEWLVRGWSSVYTGLQSFSRRWRQLMVGDVTNVHMRLQSFPQRWLRQLAAGGASSLPKHKAEKKRGKEKVSLPSEPGA